MKTIEIPTQDAEINGLLNQAREEDLLIRSADGSEYVLVAVDEFDVEIARTRQNKRLMELLDARAARPASIPLDEMKRQLGL